ncbi:hypothetical protein CYMTET_11832 [Cymbomonas tetramitiformis]|uniref:Uncharacterized protein n=1 Tax=Cymbomonas tetramitiformis TaxID=36881 RepID=A0AAE0GLA7_9CHLO|nr:hypothetical protein CYMTET_11832 [Cymbomonas tetramitiformis]
MNNVDTTDLRTSPNVYLFDDTEQEQCTCDSDGAFSDATPTYYNCPTAAHYDSRTTTLGTRRSVVRSYLADVDGATLEGAGDVRYPAECSLVAVTDIAEDADRQAATFVLEDPARVMRFPVRIVEREVVEGQAHPKDLIGASPEWTARYTEQVQNAVDDAADALSVDVAATEVTNSAYEYEYAYTFNFDEADARFPTKAQAQTVCESTLGSEWSLHAPSATGTETYRSMLQTALDVHSNARTASAYCRTARHANPYSVSDQTYIREALLAELQALLPNSVTYGGRTDTACLSSDSLNGLGDQTTRLSALFDAETNAFKDYVPEEHCVDHQYDQITEDGTAIACALRGIAKQRH